MDERMCMLYDLFSSLLDCVIRCAACCTVYRLHSPLFLQRCEMTLIAASVKRVVRSATLARHTRTGCAHAGTRAAPERNARAFTALGKKLRTDKRCLREPPLLHAGSTPPRPLQTCCARRDRQEDQRAAQPRVTVPTSDSAGRPIHGMPWWLLRGAGLGSAVGSSSAAEAIGLMAAGKLGSWASLTPSTWIARATAGTSSCWLRIGMRRPAAVARRHVSLA